MLHHLGEQLYESLYETLQAEHEGGGHWIEPAYVSTAHASNPELGINTGPPC